MTTSIAGSGWWYGEMTNDCGVANICYRALPQGEPAVAARSNTVVVVAVSFGEGCATYKSSLVEMVSTNRGLSWIGPTRIADGCSTNMVQCYCDPALAFDAYGNLFLTYRSYGGSPPTGGIALYVSSDAGSTFQAVPGFYREGNFDCPRVATGPSGTGLGSVWVSVNWVGYITALGTAVTNLGVSNISSGWISNYFQDSWKSVGSSIAVGPTGQVAVAWVTRTNLDTEGHPPSPPYNRICTMTDADGLGTSSQFTNGGSFAVNMEHDAIIKAAPIETVHPWPCLAWDRLQSGKLYLAYPDLPTPGSPTNDLDIFVRVSTNSGATWSDPPIRVNDNPTNDYTSQFHPRIAVDPPSGKVAVSWYDCRLDPSNKRPHLWAAVSQDGFTTQSVRNFRLNVAFSDASTNDLNFLEYTGLAYDRGYMFPVWPDNSNRPPDNPNPAGNLDIHAVGIAY